LSAHPTKDGQPAATDLRRRVDRRVCPRRARHRPTGPRPGRR
jgi:hypothetical protein